MSKITTHVLDISRGAPASNVHIKLEKRLADGSYRELGSGRTDHDGRLRSLAPDEIEAGVYRITFDTQSYFDAHELDGFYPEAAIAFEVRDPKQHYHVPLVLSPFGYSTYRGS